MNDLNSKRNSSQNLHLLISAVLICCIGLAYGTSPDTVLPKLFGFAVENTNLKNIFRAIMGLYLAMSVVWLIGAVRKTLWQAATITNIAFMGGLATGRIISLFMDGIPGVYFLIGLAVEIILAVWGVINLLYFSKQPSDKS